MIYCAAVFDIGTSSLKGGLIAEDGNVFLQSRLFFLQKVQAEDWLISFENMFKQFVDFAYANDIKIVGICISGNGPSLVATCGTKNKLLLWNTHVKQDTVEKKEYTTKSIFLPRFLAFSYLFPNEYEVSESFFSGQEFLIYRLTGKKVTVLPEARYLQAYWTEEDLTNLKIEKKKLPEFVEAGSFCGTYHSIPVFAGVPDFIAALIGTNTLYPGAGCDRAGSSEGLNICIDTIPPKEKLAGIRLLPCPVAPFWNIAFIIPNSGTIFYDFIKENGGSFLDFDSFMESIYSFRKNFVLNNIDEQSLTNEEKVAFKGVKLVEKLGQEVSGGMDLLETASSFNPSYTMCGGQAKSLLWRKIKTEITGRSFKLLQIADAELLGNACIVFTALKIYSSISNAANVISK